LSSFFFQAEDGIRDVAVTGVQTCALPILLLRAKLHNTQPIYICQTPEGVFGFNLHYGEPITWETRGMPKTSHFSNRQFIDKEVGYLHIKDAKRYD